MSTDPGESTTELGHQIAKLMATLTMAWLGNSPASFQIAPDREAVGGDRQTGLLLAAPAPIMARLVLDRLTQATAHLPAVGQETQYIATRDRTTKGLMIGEKAQPTGGTPTLSSALNVRAGVIWLGNVPLQPQL